MKAMSIVSLGILPMFVIFLSINKILKLNQISYLFLTILFWMSYLVIFDRRWKFAPGNLVKIITFLPFLFSLLVLLNPHYAYALKKGYENFGLYDGMVDYVAPTLVIDFLETNPDNFSVKSNLNSERPFVSYLNTSNLSFATLRNVKFGNFYRVGLNFNYSRLEKVSFHKATLISPQFNHGILKEIDFSESTLEDGRFVGAVVGDSNFSDAQISAYFTDGDLNAVKFKGSNLSGIFNYANLFKVDFRGSNLSGVGFYQTNIEDSDFSFGFLKNTSFIHSCIDETKFLSTTLSDSKIVQSVFHQTDKKEVEPIDYYFMGAYFDYSTYVSDFYTRGITYGSLYYRNSNFNTPMDLKFQITIPFGRQKVSRHIENSHCKDFGNYVEKSISILNSTSNEREIAKVVSELNREMMIKDPNLKLGIFRETNSKRNLNLAEFSGIRIRHFCNADSSLKSTRNIVRLGAEEIRFFSPLYDTIFKGNDEYVNSLIKQAKEICPEKEFFQVQR